MAIITMNNKWDKRYNCSIGYTNIFNFIALSHFQTIKDMWLATKHMVPLPPLNWESISLLMRNDPDLLDIDFHRCWFPNINKRETT